MKIGIYPVATQCSHYYTHVSSFMKIAMHRVATQYA